MAIMIPSVISPEVKSSAERKIFEWFQNALGTDKWIVLHSLGITKQNNQTTTSNFPCNFNFTVSNMNRFN